MKYLRIIIACLLLPCLATAQEDFDSLFKKAAQEAQAGSYDIALQMLSKLQADYPGNEDVIVYKGSVYGWKKDFANAKITLLPLAEREKPNMEAVRGLVNVYYWMDDYTSCIAYCDKYLAAFPNDVDVLMIKAICLDNTNNSNEAKAILEKLTASGNSEKAKSLSASLSRKAKNAISASYLNISTDEPEQTIMHYGYVEYLRKFEKSTIISRVNIGNRDDDTAAQFEMDYYQKFKNSSYLYVNAGASGENTIFPVARLGTEYYFKPLGSFDVSFGARYMHFEDDDVTLLTGQLAKRFHEYTVAYRPYYDTNNSLFSHVLSIQKYNEDKERLLRLELQYGNVPYLYLYSNSIEPLTAYRAGIQYQHRFGDSFFVRPVFLYEYEEYLPDTYRNKFNFQVIITKRF